MSAAANAAEEAVEEELSPSEELFTSVVLEQDNDTAATSCFCIYSSCQSWDEFNSQSDKFTSQSDKFICQQDEFICQRDKFNCQNL